MSVELRVRWSFSLPFGFTFWSYANHTCVPPILFSLFCAIRSSFRFFQTLLPITRRNFVKFRALPCSSSAPPSFSNRRAPTGTSSISHLPRSRFASERLLGFLVSLHLLATFKCLPHYGKESSLFVPSFLLLPFHTASLVSYPYDGLPNTSATSISSSVFSPFFMKDTNIFCSVLSFCTFIIANFSHLSIVF